MQNASSQARGFPLTVIICSRNRAQSLERTLRTLAEADSTGVNLRVLVVENGDSSREYQELAHRMKDSLPVRLLREPQAGKSHGLNRGIAECGNEEIVAVLDDDMTVDKNWLQGVRSITLRWPDKAFYTGSSFIVWPRPVEDVPAWAKEPYLASWAYSVMSASQERELPGERWASGNHYWFRKAHLPHDFRVPPDQPDSMVMCDARLNLALATLGLGGVIGPDAIVWHHIQPELLDLKVIKDRAIRVGKGFAQARLVPYRSIVKQAVLFQKHPLMARVFCLLNSVRWRVTYCLLWLAPSSVWKTTRSLKALERSTAYWEYLRACRGVPEYALMRRQKGRLTRQTPQDTTL